VEDVCEWFDQFGYAMIAADLDGAGASDLIAGNPMEDRDDVLDDTGGGSDDASGSIQLFYGLTAHELDYEDDRRFRQRPL
jgi:hypothetical protein